MPLKSESQRRFLWANHPDIAREFEDHTPKGAKLPKKVKHAFLLGASEALSHFGLKTAAEELRLQIPRREFHGWDGAFKNESQRNDKKADEEGNGPAEQLAGLLQKLDDPEAPLPNATKDHLDRQTSWGAPSNLAGGDAAGRMGIGPTTESGAV